MDHYKLIVISNVPTDTQDPIMKLISDHKKNMDKII